MQFSVRSAFSMTINKSQRQSLQHVDLCLQPEVFAQGQLYMALSRVISKAGLFIILASGDLSRRQSQPSTTARCIKDKVIKQVLLLVQGSKDQRSRSSNRSRRLPHRNRSESTWTYGSLRRSARKVMNSASNTLTLLTEGAPRVHARA